MKRWFVFAVLGLAACEKGGPTSPGPLVRSVEFPEGRVFRYFWSSVTTDSAGNVLTAYQDTVVVTVASVDDSVGPYSGLIAVNTEALSESRVSTTWYKKTDDTFTEVAYRNPGGIIAQPIVRGTGTIRFKSPARFSLLIPAALQEVMQEAEGDSIQFRQDQRIVYRFPLSAGKSWISFSNPFLQTREVGQDTLITVAGNPEPCTTMKTSLPDFSPDLQWWDYVSTKGLILRTFRFRVMFTGPEGPENLGWGTVYERLEPLSISP